MKSSYEAVLTDFLLSFGAVLTESGAVLDLGRFRLGPFWLATFFSIFYDLSIWRTAPLK